MQHLKTTGAIGLYAGLIKSDGKPTVEQKAGKVKMQREYLNVTDDVECNAGGILTVTSYSEKPAMESTIWLRGYSEEK